MIRRALELAPVSTLLLLLIEAGGDPGIFCYRMGVGILPVGGGRRLLARAQSLAALAKPKRNQVACSNPFSICSARSLILKD